MVDAPEYATALNLLPIRRLGIYQRYLNIPLIYCQPLLPSFYEKGDGVC